MALPPGGIRELVEPAVRKQMKRSRQPSWVDPMLATLTESYFSDPEWVFEPKLDGVRCLAFKKGAKVTLLSRNKLSMNDRYPAVARAVADLDVPDLVLDGEVAVVSKGVSRFQSLQRHLLEGGGAVSYFVFDVPHAGGYELADLPLTARKEVLRVLVPERPPLSVVWYEREHGERLLEEACDKGWEGLIAKHAGGGYAFGRSKEWLKFKCSKEQEFVVGGFTDPQGSRVGFGALLVGYYDGKELRYAGKVGTGYDSDLLRSLRSRLDGLEVAESPFAGKPPVRSRVHWVRPELVAQVGFGEWTRDARLRHPRFLGIRDDKRARDVVREQG